MSGLINNKSLVTGLAVLAVWTLTGCATSPTTIANSKLVPSDRIYAYNEPIDGPSGTIVVIRDNGWAGSGCYVGFGIDGDIAGRFNPKEKASFIVPARELVISMEVDELATGICNLGPKSAVRRETLIKENQTKYFRLTFDAAGSMDVQRSTESELKPSS